MKNETKMILLLIALLVFLIGNLVFLMAFNSSKSMISRNYNFTKAICDSNNYCEDFNVSCAYGKVLSIKSTGSAVQFQESWQDSRSEEEINKLC